MIITKKSLDRRTFLRGVGATAIWQSLPDAPLRMDCTSYPAECGAFESSFVKKPQSNQQTPPPQQRQGGLGDATRHRTFISASGRHRISVVLPRSLRSLHARASSARNSSY